MRDFRKLNIWHLGIELASRTIDLAKYLPEQEKFGIARQISRASGSIPSNIAEACSRDSNKEIRRFLSISIGSAFELETQFIIIQKMAWLADNQIDTLLSDLQIILLDMKS